MAVALILSSAAQFKKHLLAKLHSFTALTCSELSKYHHSEL